MLTWKLDWLNHNFFTIGTFAYLEILTRPHQLKMVLSCVFCYLLNLYVLHYNVYVFRRCIRSHMV